MVRSELLRGVRPVDAVLAAVLCALGSSLVILIITSDEPTGSRSWLMLPVFVAAMLPVLWWRRGLVGVVLFSTAAMAVHLVAFGAVVRCGAGLPLAFVLAYLAGLVEGARRRRLVALAGVGVLSTLVLVRDTAAGVGILPVALALCAGLFGIARIVAHRSAMARDLRQRNEELRRLRDERAALEVSDDRLHLSARLEALLDQRLGQLAAAAENGAAAAENGAAGGAAATRATLATLERDSRRTLDDMREIVGLLRGGEVALAPVPSVAHLDALLARHLSAGSRLAVSGDPRMLPASVELSAYRIVEHLVTAFARDSPAGVGVAMRFADDAVEIQVSGPAARGGDLREAIGRARERVLLHAGSLTVRTAHGRARVVALLPVPTGA
jgi:signal transduction histidine kinase